MIYNIQITIRRVEGAIIRTLGLIERRGFAVTSVSTNDSACETEMTLALTVESPERSVEVLIRQIGRLYDVCRVQHTRTPDHVLLQERLAC